MIDGAGFIKWRSNFSTPKLSAINFDGSSIAWVACKWTRPSRYITPTVCVECRHKMWAVVLFIAGAVKKMTAGENMADFDSAIIIRSRCFSHLSVCYFSLYMLWTVVISAAITRLHTHRETCAPLRFTFFFSFVHKVIYGCAIFIYAHTAVQAFG